MSRPFLWGKFGLTESTQQIWNYDKKDSRLSPPTESPIRVCFTGRNRAGSWEIRGRQIADRRRNWYASQTIEESDIRKFDLFCFVKRPIPKLMRRIQKYRKPIVYDVVDAWAQPDDCLVYNNVNGAREMFGARWRELPPIQGFIFSNRTMQRHLGTLVRNSTYIYHHCFPLLPVNPVRETAVSVGYQGNVSYLGPWVDQAKAVCDRLGLRFVTNPTDHALIDIGLAARGGVQDCFLSNSYKSNVKLANFYGSGTPCVVSARDCAYQETDQGDVRFFDSERQLESQIRALLPVAVRRDIHNRFRSAAEAFRVDRIVDCFEQYFLAVAQEYRVGRLT